MLSKLIVSTLAVLTLNIGSTVHAETADQRTYFTFSSPVTLPGVTLPAGRYLFRVADPGGSRSVISVTSADSAKPLAMLHTIPNELPEAPKDPEIRFMETSANTPPAIKTWWSAGRSVGHEFIYPQQQALRLAKAKTADLARIDGSGVPSATPAAAADTQSRSQSEQEQTSRSIPYEALLLGGVVVLLGIGLFAWRSHF
jgi:hypothetical protein